MRITVGNLTSGELAEITNPEFLDETLECMPTVRDYVINSAAKKAQWRKQHATPKTEEHDAATCAACCLMREQCKTTTVGRMR